MAFVVRRAPYFMAGSVLVGLAVPSLAEMVRPWVVPVSIATVMISVLRLEPSRLRQALGRPLFIILVGLVALLVLPILTALAAVLFNASPWMATGLVLASAVPPLSSATAFAILIRIDVAIVTAVSLPATLASPATVWAVTLMIPEIEEGVDVSTLVLRLSGVIAGAFTLAFTMRRFLGAEAVRKAAVPLDAAMVALIMTIGTGVMHDVGLVLREDPAGWIAILVLTWALNLLSCSLAVGMFWPAGRDHALAAELTASVKNMVMMVAAVLGAVDASIALVVITAQLPMSLTPLIIGPVFAFLYRRDERATGSIP